MVSFLRRTAEDLYEKFGEDLASVAVIFPNNRAKLFFNEFLYQAAGKPVWSPGFMTISDLFKSQSSLEIADSLTLTGILYQIYIKTSGKDESFDEFYLWGEILLSDFEDTDKNLADARQLFNNIKEQALYTDTLEHLSEEQVNTIRLFFKNFNPDRKTELKQRFIENWNILYEVYNIFNEKLRENGIAYEGMLNRAVVDDVKSNGFSNFPYEKYAFVGFNVLNRCETELFSLLQKSGKAIFYWDYDEFYLNVPKHEAGRFILKNLSLFPNELGKDDFDSFEKIPKNIRFISASTENAQARYIPEWINYLKEHLGKDFNPAETAIVLCNEGLLLPVLHSIPDEIREINVTMGFPMIQAPVFNLLNQIALLHSEGFLPGSGGRFNHRYVLPILQHPLIRQNSSEAEPLENSLRLANSFRPTSEELKRGKLLSLIFTTVESPANLAENILQILRLMAKHNESAEIKTETEENIPDEYDPMYSEAIFRCHSLASRLHDLIHQGLIKVNLHTFQKLLQKILSTASIPFSGEPVRGMQIMGMLETRNLDFKNILMLSVNEGMIPKGSTDTSFIPYNLRKGFGLTTIEHKDSIFAYYFFRLLQRAENVSLVFNTSTDGLNRGEMSRFMLQLLIESNYNIERYNLSSGIELNEPLVISIEKTTEIMSIIRGKYTINSSGRNSILSPTALNSLLDCSLRFYFKYLAGLKEVEEVTDEIDGALLGNFFHNSARYIYTYILLKKSGKSYSKESVEEAIENQTLNKDIESGVISPLIEANDLAPWIEGKLSIDEVVDYFFQKDFFLTKVNTEKPVYNGEQLIIRKLITGFLKTLLKIDRQNAPFNLLAMEKKVSEIINFNSENGITKVEIGGYIDRIDMKDNIIRVLDYKSGGKAIIPATIEELFLTDKKRSSNIFQTLLYSTILQNYYPDRTINPQILYINAAAKKDYSPSIVIGKSKQRTIIDEIEPYNVEIRENLNKLLIDLFDPKKPFCQTEVIERCEWCDFKRICRVM